METFTFQTIIDFLTQWLPIALSVIGAFAVLAAMTPNTVDDRIVQFLMDLINFLGGNLGKAKNKDS